MHGLVLQIFKLRYHTKYCYMFRPAMDHHQGIEQKWRIWFYAVLIRSDSLMMVPFGPKHVGIFSVIL